jgi:hypothetical protein
MPGFLIVAVTLLLFGTRGPAPAAAASSLETDVIEALVEHGFENVAVRERADSVAVWYENRVYRYELEALGIVAFLAASRTPPGTALRIVPQNYGTPLLAVEAVSADWLAFLREDRDEPWFRSRLAIRPGEREDSIRRDRPTTHHGSFWKTDLRVRPLFDFELGIADDPFRSAFYLAPEAVVSPWPGAIATAQVAVQVYDDLDPFARKVRPGRNTLSWGGWLPGGMLCALSGGVLSLDRYGFAGQVGALVGRGDVEISAGGDLSGLLEFSKDITVYSNLEAWSAFLAVTHRMRGIDLATTLTGARFQEEDFGVRVDVARTFRETEISFFGISTERDKVLGVRLRVPLPVRKWWRPSRVRLSTVPAFPFEYRDSLADVGLQASQFDDLDRLRKRLYPTFVFNNLQDLRDAIPD